MMNRLIEACARNKFLVFLFTGVVAMLGWYSLSKTKLDAIPDLSDTQVIVYSKWHRSPHLVLHDVRAAVPLAADDHLGVGHVWDRVQLGFAQRVPAEQRRHASES